MKKTFLFSAIAVFLGIAGFAWAVNVFNITYPIPELGNCASQADCKVYCDVAANQDACAAFAKKLGVVSPQREQADKLVSGNSGPGGCGSTQECNVYCSDAAHQDECAAFGAKHHLLDDKKAALRDTISSQGGPGGCKTEKDCKAYCDNPDNRNSCVQFAVDHGLMTAQEAQQIKELPATGPGGCHGDACKEYCDKPENQDACIAFAQEHGMISKEEAARARQLANKPGPGGCVGQACKEYCDKPENQDACLQFAAENNLISQDELAKIKKFKDIAEQGGPGGCKGQECRTYCADAAHQDECFSFAKTHGLINAEEAKLMERGRELAQKVKEMGGPGGCKSEEECRAYCANPDNVDACLAFAVEHGGFKKEEAQQMMQDFIRHNGDREGTSTEGMMRMQEQHMQQFEHFRDMEEKFRRPEMNDNGANMPAGPGGCKGPEECMQYCSDPAHQDECAKFTPHSGTMGQEGAPGMMPEGRPDMFAGKNDNGEGMPGGPNGMITPDQRTCGPKPTREAPYGCTGPVCKNGHWDYECKKFEGNPMPFGGTMTPPQQGGATGGQFQACTQEYNPVCGTDGRTYPNACFAKNANATVAKDGACDSAAGTAPQGMMAPSGSMPPQGGPYPGEGGTMPPAGMMPPQNTNGMMPPPSSQTTPPPTMPSPPQSRSAPDIFFGMILDAFRNLLPR